MAAKVVQISETTKFQMSYNVKKLRKPLRPFAGFHIILYFCTFFLTMRILDQHTKSAGGFDGVRQWKYPDAVIMERVESPTDP